MKEFSAHEAFTQRVILLAGAETELRNQALAALSDLARTEGDFDYETIRADEAPPQAWLGQVSTAPFLSPRRTLVVRHLLRVGDPSDVFPGSASPFADLPETALLILVADDEQGDATRQTKFEQSRKKWETAAAKWGVRVHAFQLDAKAAKGHLRHAAERMGKQLSERGATVLLEMCGSSVSHALEELAKLDVYVGSQPVIQESDILALVVPNREYNVYKMVDAAIEGNRAAALGQLRILLAATSKPEELAFRLIFPFVTKQLRLVWQARVLLEAKRTIVNAGDEIKAQLPESPSLFSEPEWRVSNVMRLARQARLEHIAACMQVVADTDARIKGLLPAVSVPELLEQMVLEMAEAVGRAA